MDITGLNLKFYSIKKDVPTYRLGQHYCNELNLLDTIVDGKDLFLGEDDNEASLLFMEMCNNYSWDLFDLPNFHKKGE